MNTYHISFSNSATCSREFDPLSDKVPNGELYKVYMIYQDRVFVADCRNIARGWSVCAISEDSCAFIKDNLDIVFNSPMLISVLDQILEQLRA